MCKFWLFSVLIVANIVHMMAVLWTIVTLFGPSGNSHMLQCKFIASRHKECMWKIHSFRTVLFLSFPHPCGSSFKTTLSSSRLYAYEDPRSAWRIIMTFYTEQLYEILSNHFSFNLHRMLSSTILREDLHGCPHTSQSELVEGVNHCYRRSEN